MALNCNFRPFSMPISTSQHRIISHVRARMVFDDEWIQGCLGSRGKVAVHMLHVGFKFQRRRVWVRCSAAGGPENEDSFKQQKDLFFKKQSQGETKSSSGSRLSFTKEIIIKGLKIVVSLVFVLSLAVLVSPTVLSSRLGRRSVVGLLNMAIPGHVDVQSLSLGWTKPVLAEGICLKGTDEKVVFSIRKVETQASLWSLVRGKSGLGDCTINHLWVDLIEDEGSGNLRLALALIPASKLSSSPNRAKASIRSPSRKLPPFVDIGLTATVKANGGGLRVTDGKLTVRDDVAATLGRRVFVDVSLGSFALEDDDNLRQAYEKHSGWLPLKAGMWSEGTQADTIGFIHLKKQLVKLVRPLKLEMDLSPAVAQLYLARINPLLGEVVGPTVKDEDMPDVVVHVSPEDLTLPADNFLITVEPMKAVLARGPLAGGILNLLSPGKEDIVKGKREVSLQTSHIESQASIDGNVECSRIDFLIAGKVEVATWGVMNWKDEALGIVIGIPSSTISNVLGLNLSEGYFLKIPVGGTVERPHVDWRAAAVGVAQLSLRQQGGKFFKNLISLLDSKESVPEPVDKSPWSPKS